MLDVISEVRDLFVREDALRKVAKATHMEVGEVYKVSNQNLVKSRQDRIMKWMDPFIGLVIILNAFSIGVSTDVAKGSEVWQWLEATFTLIFICELLLKVCAFGIRTYCCGPDCFWNLFDALIVLIAVFDFVFTIIGTIVNLRNFTIIRLLRFARLTKLVRVLRLKIFKELALLVNGIVAGFRTLVWAMVFLGFLQFALGVILTQTVGQSLPESWDTVCDGMESQLKAACVSSAASLKSSQKELFGSVPRSMFTVFRCFTDGCASVDGTPLVPYFYNTHGIIFVGAYMIVFLFVIFGLFNLIMAVFVENTIENAKCDDARRREARSNEHVRIAKKLQEVIVMFCTSESDLPLEDDGSLIRKGPEVNWFRKLFSTNSSPQQTQSFDDQDGRRPNKSMPMMNLRMEVSHAAFIKMLRVPDVQDMLDDLDISVNSRGTLFEVLDANCNGTLEVSELVQGLLKLRGSADKGDVVASLLAIRSVQKSIRAMEVLGLHHQEAIEGIAAAQQRVEAALEGMGAKLKSRPLQRLELLSRGPAKPGDDQPQLQRAPSEVRKTANRAVSPAPLGLNTMRADEERRKSVISMRSKDKRDRN